MAAKTTKRTGKPGAKRGGASAGASPRKTPRKTSRKSTGGSTQGAGAKRGAKKSSRKSAKKSSRKSAKSAKSAKKASRTSAKKSSPSSAGSAREKGGARASKPSRRSARGSSAAAAAAPAGSRIGGLTARQRTRIERAYHGAVQKVDESDIKYALVKTGDNVKKISDSSVAWMRTFARQVELLYKMLQEWWNDRSVLPWRTVAAITAALLYFVSPIDIVPDFLPVVGYLDDLAVVGLCVRLVRDDLREYALRRKIDLAEYGL